MKNIFRFSALLALCSLIGVVACSREELSTDQFADDTVVFSAFAPNPVVRGAELRIKGSNLDRIVEVQIPGSEPITDIEVVSSGRISEIRVITPSAGAEAASVTGPVVIVDENGKAYESKAELTFTEGIVLDSFSPASAMPGDVVTVKGDYLYNVQQIVLKNGVYVTGDQIVSKNRRELKFIVPSNAVTGPVTIGDVDEINNPDGLIPNNVPSKSELVIGDPTVASADRGALKSGAEVTVTGKYLDMIASASFGGVAVDYIVAEDGKSLKVVLPATAVDGDIVLVSFAGKEFNAGAYTTVVPTDVEIAAETRYKAGLTAVITGKDLDLVTGADLAGTALDIVYADGKIAFTIPDAAVDGAVTLALANGKTVATEAVELAKPVIKEVTPAELYAGDENITVKGEDLDLVTAVTLGGREAEFKVIDEKTIEIVTTLTSVSGKVAFTLANGVAVESEQEVKVNYHSKVIITEMPAMQHIGQEVVLKGSNFSLVENIFIGDAKVTQYSMRTDEEVRFLMPWNPVGMYSISFLLFDGDTETVATQIEVGLELDIKTIWEGSEHIAWSGMQTLAWGGYDWSTVKPGTIMTAYFTQDENPDYGPQIRFANGSWSSLPTPLAIAGGGDGNIMLDPGATYYSFKLTASDLDVLVNQGGLVITGTFFTVTKITLTTEISQEKTLWEGELVADDWANQPYALSDAGVELLNAGAQAGQSIYFYVDPIEQAWKLEIVEGHWGPTYCSFCSVGNDTEGGKFTEYDLDANGGKIKITLTQAMLDAAYVQQWWGGTFVLNGDNVKVTKITIQ